MSKFFHTYATTLFMIGGVLVVGGLIIGGLYGWGSYQGRSAETVDARNGKRAGQAVSYASRSAVRVASEQGERFYTPTFSLEDLAQEVTKREKRAGVVQVLQNDDKIEAGNVYFARKGSTSEKLRILYKIEGRGEFVFGVTAEVQAKKIQRPKPATPPQKSTSSELSTDPAERE